MIWVGDFCMLKGSIRATFTWVFIFASILPIIIVGIFSFYNISRTIHINSETLIADNLEQIDSNLHIRLDSYNDLLYQLYTDDNMVQWVENLDDGVDYALTVNQMRRSLNALLNSKGYIRAITVVTPGGKAVTYDQMSPISGESAWIGNFSKSIDEIYTESTVDGYAHIYETQYATTFANRDYYTFHIVHRIINYRDITKQCGIVILSLDQELLENVCNNQETTDFIYMINAEGEKVCYMDQDISDYQERSAYSYYDEELGWTICYYHDDRELTQSLHSQFALMLGVALITLLFAFLISSGIEKDMSRSIALLFQSMKRIEAGDLSARVDNRNMSPAEISHIADGFNKMVEKLDEAQQNERVATQKQREAQISALEAQINPHFLYNTLDTINWMAIDKDEYDISNAINALANIFRYAIVNSNQEVTVREEIEWLRQYIHLQQFRLKNSFACKIDVNADVMDCKVHKLLMQPYVENSIIHGFEGMKENALLEVKLFTQEEHLIIRIIDNGVGMPQELLAHINSGCEDMTGDRTHIGMSNVAIRLRMYYGESARVEASGGADGGTCIQITIPLKKM